jgi:putative transposase
MSRTNPRVPGRARGLNRWRARCIKRCTPGSEGGCAEKIQEWNLAAQPTLPYISTWEGWLFLATVIDCHTREVIGWATGDNYRTPLIQRAIEMAARNYPLADGAVFHSDRGSNYTSQQFAGTLKKYNLRHSVGRTGICYDNAMAESFFAALKNERVHRTQYPTREHARRDVVRYIEFWYNSRRRHSGLQYRTPRQVHEEYLERQSAA